MRFTLPTLPTQIKTFGHSMFPLLLDGDLVFLKKIRFQNVKTDDIICVRKNGKVFTHRTVYKTKSYLITKGDNNLDSDGKIYPKQIIGKAYRVKRNGQMFDLEDFYLLQSTLYFQEIVKIKNAFQKKNVTFVFLKGLPLHLHFEKQHPRRIYLDCDILISKADFSKTKNILYSFGYKTSLFSSPKVFTKQDDQKIELVFYRILNGFPIVFDVHIKVAPFLMNQFGKLNALYPYELTNGLTREFLQEKRIVRIQNEEFPILMFENLFIFLALHLFSHNFQGAHRYALIQKMLATNTINYKLVAEKINRYKLQNYTYPFFFFLKKYYPVRLPNKFLQAIQPDRSALTLMERRIFTMDIFNEDGGLLRRINKFKNLFHLSPNPLYKKLLVFLSPQVIYAIYWVISRKLFSKRESIANN